jgi:hypothetical protein
MKNLRGLRFSIFHGSRHSFLPIALSACLLLLLSPSSSHAQALSGITGTVTDESGAVVPDAKVTVTNTATGVVSNASTGSVGTFTVTDLVPGTYTVKIEKPGFQTSIIRGLNVEAGGKLASADSVLKTGAITAEPIIVTADAITLETSQPDLGTVIENKLVDEAPVQLGANSGGVGKRGRQIDAYLFLAPGVTGDSFSHRINGGVDFQNEVVFNGIPAAQSETQGFQSNINPPFEMVGEIRVLNSVFSAQYGLAQGVAYYQFKSGTNTLHGDAFEIFRNNYFDAPGLNYPNGPTSPAVVPNDKEDNFGFSLGGPVYLPKLYHGKDKTFFHVSAEWYRLNQGLSGLMTVPTTAMKGGDFSGLPAGDNIFVPGGFVAPASCLNNGATPVPGQQWAGNKIPQACFSTTSQKLLKYIPDPNPGATSLDGNLASQLTNLATRQTSWGFSIDHNLTSKQTLHGSFWRDKYLVPALDNGSQLWAATSPFSGVKNEPRIGTGLFLTYVNVFSPTLVMTAGMGWMGEINNEKETSVGFFGSSGVPGVQNGASLPYIQFTGPINVGRPTNWGPNGNGGQGETESINRKLGLSFLNNWLWTHGRHTFNIGADVRHTYQDDHECVGCAGAITFTSRSTSDGTNLTTTGSQFATFLLGEVNAVQRRFSAETKLRNWYVGPYVQDNIKVSSKLTVDVGVRWDILRPFTVTPVSGQPANTVVYFDQQAQNAGAVSTVTGQPLLGTGALFGTCSVCGGFAHANIHWHNFSPRVGFAYKLNNKTVVLAGYAVNHLDGGAYEYGNNKIANTYGQLLNGFFNVNGFSSNIAQFGEWDNNPIPSPAARPFSPTLFNGTGLLHQFSKDPGAYPYVQQWNAGIQRELPDNTLLTVSYIGNKAIHLPSMMNPVNQLDPKFLPMFCPSANPNDPACLLNGGTNWNDPAGQTALKGLGFGSITYGTTPGPGVIVCPVGSKGAGTAGTFAVPYQAFACDFGSADLRQALLSYPQYSASESCGGLCNPFDMNGTSVYNALQVSAQKRFSGGLSYLVAYTLSRNLSNTDSGFASFNFGSLNRFNQKSEWAISNNDRTHVLTIVPVYELPIGPGKKLLNHGGLVAKNLIGGWQFTGIFQYSSGTPISIGANNDPVLNGFNRANLLAGQPLSVNWNNYYSSKNVFNTSAFSSPGVAIGNSPRNISGLRNSFSGNESIGLAKRFFFGERVSAELRMEFFNVLNRMQVCGADTNVDDGAGNFGVVSSDGSGGHNRCQGNTPRQGQAFFQVRF